jgi:hypothetical protein
MIATLVTGEHSKGYIQVIRIVRFVQLLQSPGQFLADVVSHTQYQEPIKKSTDCL